MAFWLWTSWAVTVVHACVKTFDFLKDLIHKWVTHYEWSFIVWGQCSIMDQILLAQPPPLLNYQLLGIETHLSYINCSGITYKSYCWNCGLFLEWIPMSVTFRLTSVALSLYAWCQLNFHRSVYIKVLPFRAQLGVHWNTFFQQWNNILLSLYETLCSKNNPYPYKGCHT